MVTTLGLVQFKLFDLKIPSSSVELFLSSAKNGYYNDTIFHRIIDGFLIQGGNYDVNFQEKKVNSPKTDEKEKKTSANEFQNTTGTIALVQISRDINNKSESNLPPPHFFINLGDNPFLDEKTQGDGPVYTVFGKVIAGMNVVQKMAHVKLGQREGMYNVPFYPQEVVIKSIKVED